MKKVIAVIFLLMPLLAKPQVPAADALLDKAVAAMKSDAPLQMDYSYTVYDDDEVVQHDKGVMRLDAERYALLMNDMKVWSNGIVQWSYMAGINEIYITSSASEEAQNLSPLYIMEKFRDGYCKRMVLRGNEAVVTLSSESAGDAEKVVLAVDMRTNRLKSMAVHMPGQGRVEVVLDRYIPRCKLGPDAFECPLKDYPGVEIVDMR